MELIKRKSALEKSSTSGRQRNLVERKLLEEWIDFLYEVIKEMDGEENMTKNQIEQQIRIEENNGKNPF